MRDLQMAVGFLTIAPSRFGDAQRASLGHAMALFPLVGLCIGVTLACLDFLFGLALPEPARSTLVVAAGLVMSRGFHADGLADTCDGLFGGWSPERRLEIMRDSRIGSFGVIALVIDVMLRVSLLAAIPPAMRLPVIVLTTVAGRWSLVLATGLYPYARPTGAGAAFKAALTRRGVWVSTALAIALGVLTMAVAAPPWPVDGLTAAVAALACVGAVAWIVATAMARFALTLIPGLTGDVYGATNELVEISILLLAAAVLA